MITPELIRRECIGISWALKITTKEDFKAKHSYSAKNDRDEIYLEFNNKVAIVGLPREFMKWKLDDFAEFILPYMMQFIPEERKFIDQDCS